MKTRNTLRLFVAFGIASFMFGCDDYEENKMTEAKNKMPEVNDINCLKENVMKINDEETRRKFGTKCALRGPAYKKSPKVVW